MEIREALRKWLVATPAVTSLVGTRVFLNKLPQGSVYPQITLFKVSNPRIGLLSGPSGLAHPRMQIDCWASSGEAAVAVAEAVRLSDGGVSANGRLDGFRGTMAGVSVQAVNFEDERDAYFPDQSDSDTGTHQVSHDVVFWWDEG